MLKEIRHNMVSKVGELLPQSFKFVDRGIPVSVFQKAKLQLKKCLVEEESSTAFNLSVLVHNRLVKNNSWEFPLKVPTGTPSH